MRAIINYNEPGEKFWAEYEKLWQKSRSQPVFQSPGILKYFTQLSNGAMAVFSCYRENEQLIGAAFFRLNKGVYTFLSDYKTDHNRFVIHEDCSQPEVEQFFNLFHGEVQKENWKLVLNNNPNWVFYMDTFAQTGKKSKLFWHSSQTSVCPRLEENTPEKLRKSLHQSRNNRYKRNRLIREQNASFELLEGDESLEEWTTTFCDTHVERWQDTITPSKYASENEREMLLGCLKAWAADGRLVRFALKAGETRIAFVIGLLQQNSLIYHSLTYHPDFHKYSPGKVLLLYLGEWMHEKQLSILDFGDGNEPYKYNFANKERRLHSIFISKKLDLLFILKARFTSMVRNNPKLIGFYREKFRPFFKMLLRRVPSAQLRNWLLINAPTLIFDELPFFAL